MKRHFATPVASTPTLSQEELAILADDHHEAGILAEAAASDLDQIGDIADIAQDTVQIIDITPQVGRVDQDLVMAVGEMAVAGTDAAPEDIIAVPAVEGDTALTTEGIASALKSIWNAIVAAIKNLFVGFKHWLTTYFSTLEQNKKHAEKLIERLDGMKGWVPNRQNENITITDIFNYTHGVHGAILSAVLKKVDVKVDEVIKFITHTLDTQFHGMTGLGQTLIKAFDSYDGKEPAPLHDAIEHTAQNMTQYIDQLGLHKLGETYAWTGAYMLVKAEHYNELLNHDANSPETKVANLAKIRFKASQVTAFASNSKVHLNNDVTPDILKTVVQRFLDYAEKLLAFKASQFEALEKSAEQVQAACDKMLARIPEDNRVGQVEAKRLMPLVTAYANWATQPAGKMLDLAARHNKFWLSLAEMVTNNFQEA